MIIRIKKRENPYAQIDKRLLFDKGLSYKARGILAYLLAKPDDWSVHVLDLIENSPDGRESVQSGLKELKDRGYATLHTNRNEKGHVTGKEWIIQELPTDGFSVGRFNRKTEKPSVINNNRGNTNNDNTAASEKDAAYTFEKFWNEYGFKKGSKSKAILKFSKLTGADLEALRQAIPIYVRSTVTKDTGDRKAAFKPMRKYPEFFLSGRIWESLEDEITEAKARDAEPTPHDQEYQTYLKWVERNYPNVLHAAKHMSKTEYIQYKTTYYVEGKTKLGERMERTYMVRAHEEMDTNPATLDKYTDVFALHCNRVQEFIKLHTV